MLRALHGDNKAAIANLEHAVRLSPDEQVLGDGQRCVGIRRRWAFSIVQHGVLDPQHE